MIFRLYIPQSRVPDHDCLLMTELRGVAWVAGGCTSYSATGGWFNGQWIVEPVEIREYVVEKMKATAMRATIQRVVAELHRLGETSVLWTSAEAEIHYD